MTVYDAAYQELAVRRRLPLATLDGALRTAAGVVEVEVEVLGVGEGDGGQAAAG